MKYIEKLKESATFYSTTAKKFQIPNLIKRLIIFDEFNDINFVNEWKIKFFCS